jgi:pimeloyl-ACP methyl ester carboxylesterase
MLTRPEIYKLVNDYIGVFVPLLQKPLHIQADRIVPMQRARVTAQLLPDGHFFELEESGHAAPVEQFAAYNRLLEQLITAV